MSILQKIAWVLLLFAFSSAHAAQTNDFALPDMDGRIHKLSDYRGQWVLVNYWATWCPPCLEELPELEMWHSESEGKGVVLGVNLEDISRKSLVEFLDDQFLSFPILVAGGSPSADQLIGRIPGMPTSYLVSPEGKVVARQVGALTADMLNSFIAKLEKQ